MSRVITYKCVKKMQETMTNLPVYDCLKKETYCWFGSAVFAKPCLRYLTSVGLTGPGSFLVSLSILNTSQQESFGENLFWRLTAFDSTLLAHCKMNVKTNPNKFRFQFCRFLSEEVVICEMF